MTDAETTRLQPMTGLNTAGLKVAERWATASGFFHMIDDRPAQPRRATVLIPQAVSPGTDPGCRVAVC